MRASRFGSIVAALAVAGVGGCGRTDVVVYCSTDQEFAEEVLRQFEEKSGLHVRSVFEAEANKVVGLTRALIEERDHPRADVHWNNEPIQTVKLAAAGLYQPYDSPSAATIPAKFRSPDHLWTAFSARARVLLVNDDLVPASERPKSIDDLLAPKWRGKVAIARPLFGSTLTMAACMAATLGEDRTLQFFDGCLANQVDVAPGNAHVKELVMDGRLAFGLTDTDDANVAILEGKHVTMIFPDQGSDGIGTVLLPATVALVKGAPHVDAGKKLIDYLLSEEVEAALASSRCAQIPVRDSVKRPAGMPALGSLKLLDADWQKAAALVDRIAEKLEKKYLQ
ncbi:MAG: extracellular solute-binding protein [Planctomycetes bacterium]|nr:extracellular solute-binding protein [Planctomycetota bacterium]MBI3847781.1 extracellular solute-binding protein [Planctomycetota bacterium]